MNELERLKKLGEEHYRKLCPYPPTEGAHSPNCACVKAGQIWAFRQVFIPAEIRGLTLENFTGQKGGKQILTPNMVANAKRAFVKYCFANLSEEDVGDYDEKKWLDNSIIAQRHEQGHSLVIYGNPYRVSSTSEHKFVKSPIGRTMLACLVLREAINLRHKPGHEGDTYCYDTYDQICQRLLKQAGGDKSHDEEINVYKECDWLVVDNIAVRKETEAAKRYRNSVLNAMFGERIDSGLPSILVFQDDLSTVDLEEEFGTFIAQIVRNKKTHKIALVEKKAK
jgi:hypothetical protein